jgi:arylsulfatase A-like enzyme
MCYLFDVFPTLGKLCGVPAPSSSEGIEFGAVLKDTSKPARKEMMFAYMNVQRAVRDSRWKLIRYPQIDKTQLFDLTSDPEEINNLAELPEQQMRVAELMALLKKEQIRYSDPSPLQVAEPISPDWIPPKNFPKKP